MPADSPVRREPTVWTRRLQLLTAVYSVVTTVGTAIVLGYVTPEVLAERTTASAAEIDGFLPGFRAVGVTFLVLNALGIAALWNRRWIFWVAMLTNLAQAVGFFTVDFETTGMRDLAVLGTWITDGGGGLLGLVLLGFLIRYRSAWAYRRVAG
ncbi:hypothetical protein [Stackebrandtia nassauensis]|uniref:Uncharacterized protein n=1 Tax=Stackebrandtia nassauensis (strain DSM 44728 / CIP 108903 / NRRL B-16338 / NBRC 102104 / LLR-40K-21) TaxID=446470 RepID=D3PY46_STANL|nr:hypothetical protein [Stackebrandtia nassauensis]ADD45375.1 hypothetical protein Snas_5745 [Stackebrandtia nassauensis DSM 44728]